MKKLISIIVLLTLITCSVILAIPAGADETETEGIISPETSSEEEKPDDFIKYGIPYATDGVEWSVEEFERICNDKIPALDGIEISFVEVIPSDIFEMLTEDEQSVLDSDGATAVSNYPQSDDKTLDNCWIVKYHQEGYYILLYKTELNAVPYVLNFYMSWDAEQETVPVETEPVASEPAPGTGGTEPVVAPKTVDRLALIAGVLVISLTLCAAAFTVVKAKNR